MHVVYGKVMPSVWERVCADSFSERESIAAFIFHLGVCFRFSRTDRDQSGLVVDSEEMRMARLSGSRMGETILEMMDGV